MVVFLFLGRVGQVSAQETLISISLSAGDCGWSDWVEGDFTQGCNSDGNGVILSNYSPAYGSISVQLQKKPTGYGSWTWVVDLVDVLSSSIDIGEPLECNYTYRMRWFKYTNPQCPAGEVKLTYNIGGTDCCE